MSTAHGPGPERAPRLMPRPRVEPDRTPLRVVAPQPGPDRRTPFVVALVVLVVAGLVGLLLLNTAMQRRAFSLTSLDQRADLLDVQAAALTMRTDRMASPQRLRVQADELGMVPNAGPVFLRLSDGQVVGNPVPASSVAAIPGLLPPRTTVTDPPRRAAGAPNGSPPARAGAPASGDDAPSNQAKPGASRGDEKDVSRAQDRAGGRDGGQGDSQGAP